MSQLFTASPSTDHARLAALYEVSQALSSSLDIDEVLVIVMDSAIRLTGAERGFLMLFDAKGSALTFRLARNAKKENLAEAIFEVSQTVVGQVAASGKAIVTTNAQEDPRFAQGESVKLYGLRSVMAAPLVARGRILGALYVDNKIKTALFGANDLELLTTFAGQAAMTIENAQHFAQADRALAARVAEMENLQAIDRQLNTSLDFEKVMAGTLAWALRHAEAEIGWIGVVEPGEPGQPSAVRVIAGPGAGQTYHLKQPHIERALRAGAPQAQAGARASLAVPVVREGQAIAVIVLEKSGLPFDDTVCASLVRLADHAAIAIENARLYTMLQSANAARNRFVSIVSHELKTPMTAIKGYAALLQRGIAGSLTPDQSQFVEIIHGNVERMAALVNDLADISRLDTGLFNLDLVGLEVSDVLQEALAGITNQVEAKEQTLQVEVAPNLPNVRADRSSLIEIISNLVSNANKYTPPGGSITITATLAPERLSASGQHRAGDAIRFVVADTGVGISPQDQARVFNQFFRGDDPVVREQMGWGLSLHVTRRLVELLGGEITVQSEGGPGQGSVFTFTIPADK
jgi:signal transduction histidine kinase